MTNWARINLGTRELHMLLTGALAIVVAVLVVSVIVPRTKALNTAQDTVAILREAAADAAELTVRLGSVETQNETLRVKLFGDMANLPRNQVESFIVGRLQEIAWSVDVELQSIEPAAGENIQIFEESLFRLSIVGRYDDVYEWLWRVRNQLGYVVIKRYDVRRFEDKDEDPRLIATLTLASYRATSS